MLRQIKADVDCDLVLKKTLKCNIIIVLSVYLAPFLFPAKIVVKLTLALRIKLIYLHLFYF